jgi:hypothetical protein
VLRNGKADYIRAPNTALNKDRAGRFLARASSPPKGITTATIPAGADG